ncbi:MAG: hypothetical protein M3Y04_07120 [Actinomycetota bacterium]|nr:hypothetical protein [Actinomycetota bacterium]
MSRGTVITNRIVVFLVGLILLALGAAAALWWQGTLTGWFRAVPDRLDSRSVSGLTQQSWWPWAAGAVGLVLILLGLRWLVAYLPRRGVSHLKLPGSSSQGSLMAQVQPVATAAAEALEQTPGIRSARGSLREERGQLVAWFSVTVEQQADLTTVAAAADRVSAQLGQVLQRNDLVCEINLSVARRDHALARVN